MGHAGDDDEPDKNKEGNYKMKDFIDSKGRFFGKINLVDITIAIILLLAAFIAVKFVFFPTNYFHYEDFLVEVNYTGIPMENLGHLHFGKNYLNNDNNSYLILPKDNKVMCSHKINSDQLFEYMVSNGSVSKKNTTNCAYKKTFQDFKIEENRYPSASEKNSIICFFYNDSYLDKNYIMFEDPFSKPEDFSCEAVFLIKLRARIIDNEPFYEESRYYIGKGGYLDAKIGDAVFYEGKISSSIVYEGAK